MKSLLPLMTLFLVLGAGTSAQAQSAGGGGGTDRPTKMMTVSPNRPVLRCQDGDRSQFAEVDNNGDRQAMVWRTCKDGRYFPRNKPTKIIRCTEGRRSTMQVSNGNDRYVTKPTICRNGRYVEYKHWENDSNG